MKVKVVFDLEDGRYSEFVELLAQFCETLSEDSIIEHLNAYTIESDI